MEDGIEFGQLEHASPESRLRPDRDARLAVAPLHAPDPDDLPIFVDLDVMDAMEAHAVSDRSIELGGVLLGGQYLDDQGEPFVVINECIAAEHYQATKGSFKFTHQTWEQITRQREQFPEELQMVGWYHTHPGWGVFLSGMDLFICENFFNRPLDVALVIDPCRDERGMFQWTPEGQVRRTQGFYLTASRFRGEELHAYAAQLEKESSIMRPTPPYPAPPQRDPWSDPRTLALVLALAAMLTMQFLMLGVIAWKMLQPSGDRLAEAVASLEQRLEEARRDGELRAREQALDQVVATLAQDGGRAVVSRMQDAEQRLAAAEAALRGQDALRSQQEADLAAATDESRRLQKQLDSKERLLTSVLAKNREMEAQLSPADGAANGPAWAAWLAGWKWWHYALAAMVAFLGAAATISLTSKREPPPPPPAEAGESASAEH